MAVVCRTRGLVFARGGIGTGRLTRLAVLQLSVEHQSSGLNRVTNPSAPAGRPAVFLRTPITRFEPGYKSQRPGWPTGSFASNRLVSQRLPDAFWRGIEKLKFSLDAGGPIDENAIKLW